MKIGYARVSTKDQKEELQIDALNEAGVKKIFVEQASGGRWDRPELQRMIDSSAKVMSLWSGSWIV